MVAASILFCIGVAAAAGLFWFWRDGDGCGGGELFRHNSSNSSGSFASRCGKGETVISTGEGVAFRIDPFRVVEPTLDPAAKFVAEPKTVFAPRMGAVGSQVQLCCKACYRDR